MGWIERLGNPKTGKTYDMLARRVTKGLGFSLANISSVERQLGISLPEEASMVEHVEALLAYASHGLLCSDHARWALKWVGEDAGPRAYDENRQNWLRLADGRDGAIILVRKAGGNDCVAFVVCHEGSLHESVRIPRCVLVDRDQGKMVFAKEASDFFHDFATVEGWLEQGS